MPNDTRDQLLNTAKRLFASRGFYGASLANITDELGLTKQALLHHFGTKEQLYGEILQQIANRMQETVAKARADHQQPEKQLEEALLGLYAMSMKHPDEARIIVRELLDVERRGEDIRNWYLKPFLERLVGVVRSIPARKRPSDREALALLYPLLGAMDYLVISESVLRQMYGASTYRHMSKEYPAQLRKQVQDLIKAVSE